MAEITARRKNGSRPRGYLADYRPHKGTLDLLDDVQRALDEYRDYWPLACRQVYYRLVAMHGYPKTDPFYDKLCHHVANARRAKLIPFDAIRDDGIATIRLNHFDDTEHFKEHVRSLRDNYRRNKLNNQRHYVEVWCEAAGMIGQIATITRDYSIQCFSSGGFDSLSAKKMVADRICLIGKPAIVLHLGDHDPSGEALFEAVAEDVAAFVEADKPWGGVEVEYRRVALTAEQVKLYDFPTAPPKATDTRSKKWKGETCQLEAMTPDMLATVLREAIESNIDRNRYQADLHREEADRIELSRLLPAPGTAS